MSDVWICLLRGGFAKYTVMFSLVSGAFCFVISHPGDAPEFRILSSHRVTFWYLFRVSFFQVSSKQVCVFFES